MNIRLSTCNKRFVKVKENLIKLNIYDILFHISVILTTKKKKFLLIYVKRDIYLNYIKYKKRFLQSDRLIAEFIFQFKKVKEQLLRIFFI